MDAANTRESEHAKWWKPRAECIGNYIAEELASSDIILLQEWWFRDEFVDLFDSLTSHLFHRVSEQRPSGIMATTTPPTVASDMITKINNQSLLRMPQQPSSPPPLMREDGMAVLVKKNGNLEFVESTKVLTGPSRIGQLVHCRDRNTKRDILIGNTHLSFPGHSDASINDRRQAHEMQLVSKALANFKSTEANNNRLELIGGDFNSNSRGLAAKRLESRNFVNCASASAEQALSSWGGQINLGVTHRTHRGEDVSVDHIFVRVPGEQASASSATSSSLSASSKSSSSPVVSSSALRLGYLDMQGTRVVECHRGELQLDGNSVISDHRPVTATLACAPSSRRLRGNGGFGILGENDGRDSKNGETGGVFVKDAPDMRGLVHQPLDPLEPPSYMGMSMKSDSKKGM
eukprot:CAMPEP_0195293402 /NCGR_PEP_ID=MMETSP0707-20130614/12345_1 /TAXON_ID=33640 /ORGANISM="Asterionellopsis glacialis, Strain CCMP134" /LENGTH=404 /DNA_ID=CAMNT_0040354103 /DNA_START=178 /DNA_END=1392 /DNA_ORIENTATION=-